MDSPDKAALALNFLHFISDTIETISEEKQEKSESCLCSSFPGVSPGSRLIKGPKRV